MCAATAGRMLAGAVATAGPGAHAAPEGESAAERVEAHFEAAPKCPHCAHERLHRHGRANGLQRYRCCRCSKSFNALSRTPLARLRHKSKWLTYLKAMLASLSVRKAARATEVHRTTSFRWRHRFLKWIKNDSPAHLHGITEADELYFLESLKGARKLPRPARRRAGRGRPKGHVQIAGVRAGRARSHRPNSRFRHRPRPSQ